VPLRESMEEVPEGASGTISAFMLVVLIVLAKFVIGITQYIYLPMHNIKYYIRECLW
jgi:hypothetical protein